MNVLRLKAPSGGRLVGLLFCLHRRHGAGALDAGNGRLDAYRHHLLTLRASMEARAFLYGSRHVGVLLSPESRLKGLLRWWAYLQRAVICRGL